MKNTADTESTTTSMILTIYPESIVKIDSIVEQANAIQDHNYKIALAEPAIQEELQDTRIKIMCRLEANEITKYEANRALANAKKNLLPAKPRKISRRTVIECLLSQADEDLVSQVMEYNNNEQ